MLRSRSVRPSDIAPEATLETTLSQVRDLLPAIAKRSEEIEDLRMVPADLVAALSEAGCLRMFVPSERGGDNLAFHETLRIIEELATADASTGWTIGQVGLAQMIFDCFPPEAQKTLYAAGPDLFGAGAVAPKGRAVRKPRGWRVSGQWPFLTGCDHAAWVYLNCVVVDGRKLQLSDGGVPLTR